MGSPRFTLRTGVLVAALALAPVVPAAYAADGDRSVSVVPSTPVAGGEVALKVSGCTGKTAKAVSGAFVSDARLIGTDGTLVGETKIRSMTEPGAYAVTITCADIEIKGRITVAGPGATPHATPVAPVRAGGGGAADLLANRVENPARTLPHPRTLAQPRATAPNTAHAVTGLTLAGLAALAVLALRGVLRRRGATAAAVPTAVLAVPPAGLTVPPAVPAASGVPPTPTPVPTASGTTPAPTAPGVTPTPPDATPRKP
ncbi:hypothetical protein [Streptomyces niveiscabiei]|uniref:hypothetical protein n=1 Tax=Streptomyces niveiscabiei TaxID=164115 RepID=UPI0029CA3DC1|nr:hypothetical protein [Streptomyces niveiscabiei]